MESTTDRVKTKRERNVNYTREESEKLVTLIESKINIIENKKNHAGTWHEKEKAWKAIEVDFNRAGNGTVYRDAKHLKIKYEAMKKDIRKKCRLMCVDVSNGAGAGVGPLTPIEQRVKEMILTFEASESFSDPDPLEIPVNQESGTVGLTNNVTVSIKQEENYSDSDSAEDSNIITCETPVENSMPKKRCLPHENGWTTSKDKDQDKTGINEPTEKGPLLPLAEEQVEMDNLQRQLLEEELEQSKLKKQILMEELKHKNQMFALEKEQLLLKIEILKLEIENKKML